MSPTHSPAEWIARCAVRLKQLGVKGTPGPVMLAQGLADEQREKFGVSALAWERPEDVAEQNANDDDDEVSE